MKRNIKICFENSCERDSLAQMLHCYFRILFPLFEKFFRCLKEVYLDCTNQIERIIEASMARDRWKISGISSDGPKEAVATAWLRLTQTPTNTDARGGRTPTWLLQQPTYTRPSVPPILIMPNVYYVENIKCIYLWIVHTECSS